MHITHNKRFSYDKKSKYFTDTNSDTLFVLHILLLYFRQFLNPCDKFFQMVTLDIPC